MYWFLRAACRNHKFTMLMSDAFDGNAKTLLTPVVNPEIPAVTYHANNLICGLNKVKNISTMQLHYLNHCDS